VSRIRYFPSCGAALAVMVEMVARSVQRSIYFIWQTPAPTICRTEILRVAPRDFALVDRARRVVVSTAAVETEDPNEIDPKARTCSVFRTASRRRFARLLVVEFDAAGRRLVRQRIQAQDRHQ